MLIEMASATDLRLDVRSAEMTSLTFRPKADGPFTLNLWSYPQNNGSLARRPGMFVMPVPPYGCSPPDCTEVQMSQKGHPDIPQLTEKYSLMLAQVSEGQELEVVFWFSERAYSRRIGSYVVRSSPNFMFRMDEYPGVQACYYSHGVGWITNAKGWHPTSLVNCDEGATFSQDVRVEGLTFKGLEPPVHETGGPAVLYEQSPWTQYERDVRLLLLGVLAGFGVPVAKSWAKLLWPPIQKRLRRWFTNSRGK